MAPSPQHGDQGCVWPVVISRTLFTFQTRTVPSRTTLSGSGQPTSSAALRPEPAVETFAPDPQPEADPSTLQAQYFLPGFGSGNSVEAQLDPGGSKPCGLVGQVAQRRREHPVSPSFLKSKAAAIEEGPDHAVVRPHAFLLDEPALQFFDGGVRCGLDRRQQEVAMGVELGAGPASLPAAERSPLSRRRSTHLVAVETPTSKRTAAWRADVPFPVASITLSRKS